MRRTASRLISLNALSHFRYLPAIVSSIENWDIFLQNYIAGKNGECTYRFRGGLKFHTKGAFDAATLAVVFFKKDYGAVADGMTIVDIGANIGAFSIYAASQAENVRIYAYEPMPENFEVCRQNIDINDLGSTVKAFRAGVAERAGPRRLYLSGSPFHTLIQKDDTGPSCEINCTTLEDIFVDNQLEYIDLLKIDCEGAEYEILYNLPDAYFNKIKSIRMEYHNKAKPKENIDELRKFLVEKGYIVTSFRRDSSSSGIIWLTRQA